MANTPVRTLRVPDDVWAAVTAKADADGVTVTTLVVSLLREHVMRTPSTQ